MPIIMKTTRAPKNTTQGFRPRARQVEELNELLEFFPEITMSIAVRSGLDWFIEELREQLKKKQPKAYQSITVLQPSPHENHSHSITGKSRNPARRAARQKANGKAG